MKTNILLLLVAILICNFSFGQKRNIRIEYEGYLALVSGLKREPVSETYVISDGNLSISWSKQIKDSRIDTSIRPYKSIANGMENHVFKDFQYSRIIFHSNSGFIGTQKNYYFSDSLNAMQWTLVNRVKTIDSIACRKAITIFRGRAYIAWYNPEIAISEGPWKFGGLPGLIMEVYDDEREVYWKFKSLTNTNEQILSLPTEVRGDFAKYKQEFNLGLKKIIAMQSADQKIDPSCIKCNESVKVTVQTIENLTD